MVRTGQIDRIINRNEQSHSLDFVTRQVLISITKGRGAYANCEKECAASHVVDGGRSAPAAAMLKHE